MASTNWVFPEAIEATWTAEENKRFEKALAFHDDKDNPNTWFQIAQAIPGKTVDDVIRHYKELLDDVSNIEAGLVPIPGYNSDYFFNLENSDFVDYIVGDKRNSTVVVSNTFRSPMAMPPEKERKKGVPWTEQEHRLFLMGLKKYGKGDWRNIAKNYVKTRTPTQVASHAQKYFIRQLTDGKDKRRSSIHDITTVNIPDVDVTVTTSTTNTNIDPTSTFSNSIPNNSTFDVLFRSNLGYGLASPSSCDYIHTFSQEI